MRSTTTQFKLKAIALGVIASFTASGLHAQLAIEEIIVSARKTEENVQNIPIALNAVSSQTIQERGISDIADIASITAGLVFDEGLLPNDTRPVIRGLSATRGRANVATLIDDVDVTSESLTVGGGGMTGNMRLMDLERVEVVKGPQSVLYGRSAFTGAVNYVNKRPDQDFGGEVNLDVDEFGSTEAKLSVTGGLTDELAARLNLAGWDGQGWDYKNPNTNDDLGTGDMSGASLALEWAPTDEFTAYTRLDYSDEEYAPRATVMQKSWLNATNDWGELAPGSALLPYSFSPAQTCADNSHAFIPNGLQGFGLFKANCVPALVGSVDGKESQIDLSPDPQTGNDYRGTELETFRAHLDLRWEFEDYELRSITARTQNNVNIQEDFDLTNYSLNALQFPFPFDGDGPGPAPSQTVTGQYGLSAGSDISHELEQFSQEFRLLGTEDKFSWFLSALYWTETLDTTWDDSFWLRDGGFPLFFTENTAPAYAAIPTLLSRDTDHMSLAGSITWDLTDSVSWTVEGRYLEEEVKYTGTNEDRGAYTLFWDNFGFQPNTTACDFAGGFGSTLDAAPCGSSRNKITSYEFVPRTSIDWQITEDVMTYFTYAEGFKPGGVDTTAATGDVSGEPYEPETLKTYELGAKTAWNENRLLINGALFYYDYTDLQQSIQIQPLNGLTTTQVVNAGAVENKGFEFDVTYRVLEELTVTFGYVYSNATYEDFDLLKIATENALPGDTPKVSANNAADAGNASGNFDGKQLPLSAKKSATLGVRYEDEVAAGMTGFAEIQGSYQSERYLTPGNWAYLPSNDLWNVSFGLDAEQWRAIVYIDNVFDDDKIKSGVSNTDYGFFPDGQSLTRSANLQLPQPRTIGIRGTYRF